MRAFQAGEGIAGYKPAENAADKKAAMLGLYRFDDKKRGQRIYTTDEKELNGWRLDPDKKDEELLGYASPENVPGTVRLWRANRKDGRFYIYLVKNPAWKDMTGIVDPPIYVWTKAGDGRVAIHGGAMPDGSETFFDRDLKKVRQVIDETLSGINVRRIPFPSAFYLYEKAPEAKPGAADK